MIRYSGCWRSDGPHLVAGEALVDLAAALHSDQPRDVCVATYGAEVSVGRKITRGTSSDSTTSTALAEVQQMSDSAFTSAEVFQPDVTTGASGYRLASARTSAAVDRGGERAPASWSGMRTVLPGFRIFAVSAMKWTPAEDDDLGVCLRRLAREGEGVAGMSAIPWNISGVW